MPEIENIEEENSKSKVISSREEELNENISKEQTIETTAPKTQNSQSQTEEMEVHHHPKVEKKNFKEYLLEGLMIFIAVTLGFFAENIRESRTERSREKEYIVSIIDDLKSDSASLHFLIQTYMPAANHWIDSAISFT